MIPFNIPPYVPESMTYLKQVVDSHKICGDGTVTKECHEALQKMTGAKRVLLTTSGTSALELSALLVDIQAGDEVILPSFTFSSTANAFALRGAQLVFVDVDPVTMNMDPACVREAITSKTKCIVPVHYGGVCCDMQAMQEICDEYGLLMVEDAAQAVTSTYRGKQAGTLSHLGCFSFHETKNFSMGEGGAILINDDEMIERAEIIREKGTDRSRFFRGQVDKYTWVDIGSSLLPSELNAAYLLPQLQKHETITQNRMARWIQYQMGLQSLAHKGTLELMQVPDDCTHNAHMFYVKVKDQAERAKLISHLATHEISAVFHYVPLHSAMAGVQFGRFHGEDRYTTKDSERLLRLPMYYGLSQEDCEKVINSVQSFFK